MKYEPKIEKEIMCPIEYGLDIFGGKWKSRIICVLSSQDAMRYSEVRKKLNNITDAVLAAMLKELMEDRIISRTQYNEIPPRVEYSLTDQGRSVLPILQSICAWSRQYTPESLEKKLPPCQTCPQL
ncbi:winged helix-turn-helix transcriptional regulator [Enterocloster asparagiformis]|uniref:winged helix-turn-helix transcriptional regulator n=1 Tax=Enterocloster asparagiformis TaxID=333367 RepID=UPI0004649020|nr:helix-turn-helix domain-containing protein [Enterocloster asparagiformis]